MRREPQTVEGSCPGPHSFNDFKTFMENLLYARNYSTGRIAWLSGYVFALQRQIC